MQYDTTTWYKLVFVMFIQCWCFSTVFCCSHNTIHRKSQISGLIQAKKKLITVYRNVPNTQGN